MKHPGKIISMVDEYGALIFRGFDIKSPNEALSILKQLGLKNFEYEGGSPVRNLVVGS